jgi:hypothetical protein
MQSLIGKIDLAVFQKKLGTKRLIFTQKKLLFYFFLLSFGPKVHFRGQKMTFWQKKIRPIKLQLWGLKSLKIATTLWAALYRV